MHPYFFQFPSRSWILEWFSCLMALSQWNNAQLLKFSLPKPLKASRYPSEENEGRIGSHCWQNSPRSLLKEDFRRRKGIKFHFMIISTFNLLNFAFLESLRTFKLWVFPMVWMHSFIKIDCHSSPPNIHAALGLAGFLTFSVAGGKLGHKALHNWSCHGGVWVTQIRVVASQEKGNVKNNA